MMTEGHLQVTRMGNGYVAVLRVQGADGSSVGLVSTCSYEEAQRALGAAGVGFSFKKLGRWLKKAASTIAKSKVFKTFLAASSFLPPPVSLVASAAKGAAKVLDGMQHGDRAALKEWKRAASEARANPHSTIAAGMRLAMDAKGKPVMRTRRTRRAAQTLVREILDDIDQRAEPAPEAAPEAAPAA